MPAVAHDEKPRTSSLESAPKTRLKRSLSFVVVAGLLLGLTDLSARSIFHPDPYASPNRSFAYFAVNDYQKAGQVDVAIFGSSLMAAAINDGDATYLKHSFDTLKHHRAVYLEKLLAGQGKPLRSATFAIGGEMGSDAYALISTLFTGEHKPQSIIWGIAPRDFLDATFKDPNLSETIHYLRKVKDGKDVLGAGSNTWSNMEYSLEQIFYLFGKRHDLVLIKNELANAVVASLTGKHQINYAKTPPVLRRLYASSLPEDNWPGEWPSTPYASTNPAFPDNLAEYKSRYARFDKKIFAQQIFYLAKSLTLCRQLGIKVTLVNMPLRADNLALLPEGAYSAYLKQVQALAGSESTRANLIDLNRDGLFSPDQFGDSVHLNGKGGVHFFQLLAKALN